MNNLNQINITLYSRLFAFVNSPNEKSPNQGALSFLLKSQSFDFSFIALSGNLNLLTLQSLLVPLILIRRPSGMRTESSCMATGTVFWPTWEPTAAPPTTPKMVARVLPLPLPTWWPRTPPTTPPMAAPRLGSFLTHLDSCELIAQLHWNWLVLFGQWHSHSRKPQKEWLQTKAFSYIYSIGCCEPILLITYKRKQRPYNFSTNKEISEPKQSFTLLLDTKF